MVVEWWFHGGNPIHVVLLYRLLQPKMVTYLDIIGISQDIQLWKIMYERCGFQQTMCDWQRVHVTTNVGR